ncbi:MAG: Nudix family hydrolase [Azospira oryzae]|nr:MAG: Nudix family hydrolase [Azospira oryzae]PZP77978.1 MAG: Nudix family hydrolase [Azospira oryzae]
MVGLPPPPAPSSLVAPERVQEVAVAVILRSDGRFLLGRRPAGKVYAGYWEFPGGKVEPGESAVEALQRELHEELELTLERAYPWITRTFVYPHATVRLRFFRVVGWHGALQDHEHEALTWQQPGAPVVEPMLPANGPVLKSLELPDEYAITFAEGLGTGPFLARLAVALERGVRLIQLREKSMAPEQLRAFGREVLARAREAGAKVLVNGDAATAEAMGADGVHLSAAALMALPRRPAVAWCGASCHNEAELARAAELGVDFVALGPVLPTLSHPGAPPLGWRRFADLVRDYPLPVFALGGMRRSHLETAWQHGAHGVACMRAAWASPDDFTRAPLK